MKKLVPIIILVAIVAVVGGLYLSNRGSDTTATPTYPATTTTPSTNTTNTTKAPANATKVTINNFAFSPAALTVKKGTTVTWTNQDGASHTVTEVDGQTGPKSDSLSNGQSYSFTFDTAGTFKYHCTFHETMTGSVTVTD